MEGLVFHVDVTGLIPDPMTFAACFLLFSQPTFLSVNCQISDNKTFKIEGFD